MAWAGEHCEDCYVVSKGCYDDIECCFVISREETEIEYQIRYKKYLSDLDKYNKWYEKNKKEVEKRVAKNKMDKQEENQKHINRLENALKKLKKEKG
jgi:hypothetical protein